MASQKSVSAVILAAGKGTRMKSSLPKVLHPIAGRAMVAWVIEAVRGAGVADVAAVLGPDLTRFDAFLTKYPDLRVAIQHNQRGTGDAVASAAVAFEDVDLPSYAKGDLRTGKPIQSAWVLVVTGDTPAITPLTLKSFCDSVKKSGKPLGVLGMNVPDPRGYGRIVRDAKGGLSGIIEERDADAETKKIKLCNSGIIMAKTSWLFELLGNIAPNNSQNEYYLTDVFGLSAKRGEPAHVFETNNAEEFAGVNDRVQLEAMEQWLLKQRLHELMLAGVTLHRPDSIYVEADVTVEQDVEIFPGVSLLNGSRISRNVKIGPGSVLDGVNVGAGSVVGANAVLTRLSVMAGGIVPPGTNRTELNL